MILGRASYRPEWLHEWVDGLVEEPKKRRSKPKSLTGPDNRNTETDVLAPPNVAAST
jgi:hypothetical protein